jgi:hypothetical protein
MLDTTIVFSVERANACILLETDAADSPVSLRLVELAVYVLPESACVVVDCVVVCVWHGGGKWERVSVAIQLGHHRENEYIPVEPRRLVSCAPATMPMTLSRSWRFSYLSSSLIRAVCGVRDEEDGAG